MASYSENYWRIKSQTFKCVQKFDVFCTDPRTYLSFSLVQFLQVVTKIPFAFLSTILNNPLLNTKGNLPKSKGAVASAWSIFWCFLIYITILIAIKHKKYTTAARKPSPTMPGAACNLFWIVPGTKKIVNPWQPIRSFEHKPCTQIGQVTAKCHGGFSRPAMRLNVCEGERMQMLTADAEWFITCICCCLYTLLGMSDFTEERSLSSNLTAVQY